MTRLVNHLVAAVALVAAAGCGSTLVTPASTASPGPKLDVIWVPSEMVVVRQMLQLAGVGREDVVYDLGSGDGRIVIMAAQQYGARGIGVDIDPEMVRRARENAVKAGVADRVTFLEGDLFAADISAATVVAMYLGADLNLRLRPKLQRELRPGTRVVSHDYDLGDWAPERTVTVNLENRDHLVFLWRIPR